MHNYNEFIRELIDNWFNIGLRFGLDRKELLNILIPNLYNVLDYMDDDTTTKLFSTYILGVAFLDAYKMFSYKQKQCQNNDLDEDVFGILNDIESFDDLLEAISTDEAFFEKILVASSNFRNLNYLGRYLVMKSLSEEENYFLSDLFPVHELDMASYDNDVDLKTIVDYMQEKKYYQENISGIVFKGGIVANVIGFIRELLSIDPPNALNILLEISKADYKISKYLISAPDMNEVSVDLFQEHINLYENSDTDDIMAKMVHDQDFLKDAVFNLLYAFVEKSYNDIDIDVNLLDNEEVEKVIKKMIFEIV